MRFRTSLGLLSLVLAAAATAPSVSGAALTTIGSQTLTTEGATANASFSKGTFIQYSELAPTAAYVSPVEGTIVTWRIASGSSGNEVRLRVLRPAGGGTFTGVGTSASEMTSAPLATFETSLPIKAGDVIALDNESEALIFTTGVLGTFPKVFKPALADGAPAATPEEVVGGGMGLKLQINADIQPTPPAGGGSGSSGSTGSTGSTGSGGGATGGSSGASGGTIQAGPPALAGLKVVPNSLKKRTGATLRYTDTQAATTTFNVLQRQPGRRTKKGECAKPTRKVRGRPCTRLVKIDTFTHADTAGANSFHVTGLVNGRALKPGAYLLQAIARNAGGLTSKPLTISFSVHR